MKARRRKMQVRNSQVVFGLCCWLAAMVGGPSHATAGQPTDQIKTTVDQALVVLKDPRLKAPANTKERRDQLKQILFARFDFNEMAKRALGAEWRKRTPKEQEEFVSLFTELLERSYTETIEAYTDEKISYLGERIDGSYADVNSKLLTSKGEEVPINYNVQLNGGDWRVYSSGAGILLGYRAALRCVDRPDRSYRGDCAIDHALHYAAT